MFEVALPEAGRDGKLPFYYPNSAKIPADIGAHIVRREIFTIPCWRRDNFWKGKKMEVKIKRTKVVASVLALAALVIFSLTAGGGNLEPTSPPGPTMKTLDEIYTAASSGGSSGQVSGTEFAADSRSFIAMHIGEYPGSGIGEGLEDASKVIDLEHTVMVPLDPSTGLPSSSRRHGLLTIVKNIDKATPGLHKALCTGQILRDVVLDFYRLDPSTGQDLAYYKITLRNAMVVDIGPTTNFVTPDSYKHMERVSFVYEEIEWNWLPDDIIEMDRWTVSGGS